MGEIQQRVLMRGRVACGHGFRKASAPVVSAVCLFTLLGSPALARKFYPDDPLQREPAPAPVPDPKERSINEYYDFFLNTFFGPGKEAVERSAIAPSDAVNTLGEVPDSAWYTNRIGTRPMSISDLVRGPGNSNAPSTDKPWTVLSGKTEGITPGLLISDSRGRRYLLKFDPKSNPEMASAADVIGSKFFHALGYNTPENYIVEFERSQLAVGAKSKFTDETGSERQMTDRDVDEVLRKGLRNSDGRYRVVASLFVPGKPIGPFRYHGTRADDPNDIVDHEKRRDLRGLYVFAAWLNHTDTKSLNSLDSVVDEDGLKYVRHYLIDFGAILGSDSFESKSPRAGNVYLFDFKPAAWQLLSLGLYTPAWMRADFPKIPEVGRLDYENFDPRRWKNNYPNPAFDQRTPGDTFWAAKKVMAFSDEAIRAIVETGEYSDPRAADWVTKCLIERRDRIGRAFFEDVLPLDEFHVRGGELRFEDLAVKYGFRNPRQYSISWFEFDNVTDARKPIPGRASFHTPDSPVAFLGAEIRGADPRKSVVVYLRGDQVVGIDRTW